MNALERLSAGRMPGVEQDNTDGSSSFRAYRIDEFPTDFVIARKRADNVIAA